MVTLHPSRPSGTGMPGGSSTPTGQIRRPAVAGSFYPAAAEELAGTVDRFLDEAARTPSGKVPTGSLKAIIAPHAGYVYSGHTAATAYALLRPLKGQITRVVLLGPSHRVAFRGIALCSYGAYETALGRLPIDTDAYETIRLLPDVVCEDRAHAQDHSLEVQLPFVQRALGAVTIVPLIVGSASLEQVRTVLDALWGDEDTVVIISSDLSHFLDQASAKRYDAETIDGISHLDITPLTRDNSACGRLPIAALLNEAHGKGLAVQLIDHCTSADTAGTPDRVVGYGAWAFYQRTMEQSEAALADLLTHHGQALRDAACRSIEHGLDTGAPLSIDRASQPDALRLPGACFVTLTHQGQLRGCIGSAMAWRPLIDDVVENAFKAAFHDPRFAPVSRAEWPTLSLSLSLLTPPAPMAVSSREDLLAQLRPGIDGLILHDGAHRALFLPSVWEQLPEAEQFVGHLLRKAGLADSHWSRHMKAQRFTSRCV